MTEIRNEILLIVLIFLNYTFNACKIKQEIQLNRINAFIISIFIDFGHCPLPLRNVLYTKCPTFVYFAICWFAALCHLSYCCSSDVILPLEMGRLSTREFLWQQEKYGVHYFVYYSSCIDVLGSILHIKISLFNVNK